MTPTLEAYRVWDDMERSSLWVWCMYECKWHFHGADIGDQFGEADGHRTAHCQTWCSPYRRTGYYLKEVTGPRQDGECSKVRCEGRR